MEIISCTIAIDTLRVIIDNVTDTSALGKIGSTRL